MSKNYKDVPMYKRRKTYLTQKNTYTNIALPFIACIASGFVLGGVYAFSSDITYLVTYSMEVLRSSNFALANSRQFIINSFVGYAVFILIMWCIGLTRFVYANFGIIIFRGASIGFVSTGFTLTYGLVGLLYAFALFIPQSILLVVAYFFINHMAFKFRQTKNILEYGVSLALCMLIILLISMYEGLVLPFIPLM